MNQASEYRTPEFPFLLEAKEFHHEEAISILVVTQKGTGQVLDIHREGFSFGCLYPHTFPNDFYVDILDAKGSYIKNIRVKKMWETIGDYQESGTLFELVVGIEFCDLTPRQTEDLDELLEMNTTPMDLAF